MVAETELLFYSNYKSILTVILHNLGYFKRLDMKDRVVKY